MAKARIRWVPFDGGKWMILSPIGFTVDHADTLENAMLLAMLWVQAYRTRGAL